MKKATKVLLLFCFCLLLTGCLGAKETDELAYVLAMGIDKGKKDRVLVTFQIANTKTYAGGGQGGGEAKPVEVTSLEGPSVFACMNMLNAITSRQISLMHCKVFMFGEEMARSDMYRYLQAMMRFREVRGNAYIVVAKKSAQEVIKKIAPTQETPSKYYDLAEMVESNTGLTKTNDLNAFYGDMKSPSIDTFTILMGNANKELAEAAETPPPEDFGSYFPGEIPREGEMEVDAIGSAIFKGEKLVGQINGDETKTLLLLRGDFRRGFYNLPDPANPEDIIVLAINQGQPPDIEVDIPNKTIRQTIYLEGEFFSIQSGLNYESPAKKKEVEQHLSALLEQKCQRLLDKLQQDYQSDTVGYGIRAKRHYLTWQEWEQARWLEELYPEMNIQVQVKTVIRRTGLLLRTEPLPK